MDMKYIIVTHRGLPCPILFCPLLTHSEVAESLRKQVESAGFVSFGNGTVVVPYGKSHSLNLGPHEDDQAVIKQSLGIKLFETGEKDDV